MTPYLLHFLRISCVLVYAGAAFAADRRARDHRRALAQLRWHHRRNPGLTR